MPLRMALILFATLATNAPSLAQSAATANVLKLDKPENSPKATITDVAWIEGRWAGEALGGTVEEIWTAPQAGAMLGSFRSIRQGKAAFYEILVLAEEKESLVLRIKHFDPDLRSWEKQDECARFPLVKLEKDAAYFGGLIFKKDKNGDLLVWVLVKRGQEDARELSFRYHPVKNPDR